MSWRRFFRRGRWDEERARELQEYLAQEIDDNLARGMRRVEAVRAAHRKLGNPTLIREQIYDMNTLRFLDSFWQDLRFGARLLLRNRTFAIVAIVTLALGTGANAAIFHLIDSVRLRSLPVERPGELVHLNIETHDKGRMGRFMSRRPFFSEPLLRTIAERQQAFAHLFAWGVTTWNSATDGDTRRVQGVYVTGNFFEALGIAPHVGRLMTAADDRVGCGAPGVVLTYGFWQSRFGGTPAAIGQPMVLDGRSFDVIGVTPPSFFGAEVGRSFDVAVPLCAEPLFRGELSGLGRPDSWFLDIMARLAPDWTVARAQGQLEAISPGVFASTLPPTYPPEMAQAYEAFTLTVEAAATGVSTLRRDYETQLWALLAATGIVMLIMCANLANLMLARASARQREIAVRLAIGASRSRIVRQMLSESLLLAALGAAAGGVLAQWISRSLVAFLETDSVQLHLDLAPDWRLFAFIGALAAAACVLFGLSPALEATGTNPSQAIQAGGRSSTDSPERLSLRRALVVVQVALSIVLVVGAVLLGRSLINLVTLDPGFRQEGLVAVDIDLRRSTIGDDVDARIATYAAVAERARRLPGVVRAAEAYIVPLSGSGWNEFVHVAGEKKDGVVHLNRVGPDYFATLETPLLAGRTFGPEDRRGTPEVAIVNELFAAKHFGEPRPIGRTFQLDPTPGTLRPEYQVIGVVANSKYSELREALTPLAYFPLAQAPDLEPSVTVVLRSDLPLASLRQALTGAIREIAPGSTVDYTAVSTYARDSLVTERLMASLSAFLGALATLIAAVGLYGVLSYMVSRRRVEIGVRVALGADPRRVVRMVLGETGALFAVGIAAGVGLAIWAAHLAATLLFGLAPWDPASVGGAVALLGGVSLVATWIPARRASHVPPTIALRAD
jgi:predicted permease